MLSNYLSYISGNITFEIISIIIIATIFGYIARLLKQPLIPAYIIAGLILGPIGFRVIGNQDIILTLSEIGIAFLLFFVGLEINLKRLQQVAKIAIFGTILQVAITFLVGYFASNLLGFNTLNSVYLGLIVAFSSTMVVIKILSDKDIVDTLHGKIILGMLLMQDLIIVAIMASVKTLDNFMPGILGISLLKALVLFIIAIVIGKAILPRVFRFAAESEELLFLCSLGFCFIFSVVALLLDFSIVIGAFIAGLSLASLPYSFDIAGMIKPLKDFFALLFFVSLGMSFIPSISIIFPFIVLLLIVLILKPLIIFVISNIFNYEKRTAFLSALPMAQVSEFSLILAALGLKLGHIGNDIFALSILMSVTTIGITPYLMDYDKRIYEKLKNKLKLFEKLSFGAHKLEYIPKKHKKEFILIGCHRMGSIFLKTFNHLHKRTLVIDHNFDVINELMENKLSCIYGDMMNEEVLKKVKIDKAKIVISTVPEEEGNMFLINHVKKKNKKALVFVTAKHLHEAFNYYTLGADYVILPHLLAGETIAVLLKKLIKHKISLKKEKDKQLVYIDKIRKKHIDYLNKMQLFGK